MRAVLTRVKSASVTIDGEVVGKIGQGFLILLGVGPNDTEKECRYLAEKALGLRVFEDENGNSAAPAVPSTSSDAGTVENPNTADAIYLPIIILGATVAVLVYRERRQI